jgi:hypothetical protein
MDNRRLVVVLTVTNLGLIAAFLGRDLTVEAQSAPAVLRAQRFELVDAGGQVRASLEVAGDSEALLRLRDSNGAVRVKLGGGAEGSGLVLFDDSTEPGVQIIARKRPTAQRPATTSVKLFGPHGRKRVLTP